MPSLPDLAGRTLAVSGVGSAFGGAIAEGSREQGARVYGCHLDPTGLEALVAMDIGCTTVVLRDRVAAEGRNHAARVHEGRHGALRKASSRERVSELVNIS